MAGWEVAHLDELDAIPVAEGLVWHPVRRRFGVESFGVNAYTSEHVGGQVVEDHDESGPGGGGHEELYVVVRGLARFTVDGESFQATAGTVVYVRDPALRRSAIAEANGTVVLAVGGERRRSYRVSPWESYFAALPALRAGRWDDAIALIEAGLRDHPGNPSILYNLAAAESRAGRGAEALAHLEEAVRAKPELRERAAADPDFDAVRREDGFPA
jgi:tetratricopeptide (TPR) repeat protein